jgi:hypothetical protein
MAQPKDLLRLTEVEKRAALELLDRRALAEPGRASRTAPRHKLVEQDKIIVEFGQADSLVTAYVVPRDVSEGGVSFLHGVFVYSGTACVTLLRTRDKETMLVPGKVVRCTHVTGRVHEVGVKFDSRIDVAPFFMTQENALRGGLATDAWSRLSMHQRQLTSAIEGQDVITAKKLVDAMLATLSSVERSVA